MPYSRPGIYVNEGPFTTNVTSSPAAVAAAFVGTAERGPTTPALVQSWNSYKTQFGDLTANYEMGYALYHFFANGGRTAYVTRVISGASTTAAATVNVAGTVATVGGTVFALNATSKGAWGNNLSAVITAGNNTGSTPTFNMKVTYNSVEVENWSELSLNKDDSRYIAAVVNNYSAYLTVTNVNANLSAGTAYTVTNNTYNLASGNSGSAINATDWNTALRTLDDVEGQLTINLVGQSNSTIVNAAIAYVDPSVDATARKNSFLVIDPDPAVTAAGNIVSTVAAYTASSYAAVYYGMLSMSNPAVRGSAAIRATYPGGAILGLYQRVDAERGVGRAPAGYSYTLQNAYGVVTKFSEASVGTLYNENINTLKNVAGGGVIVNGARTLKKTDLTKYIPSRRTLNYVKAQVEEITSPALFEPIGPRLWASIAGNISKMLSNLWATGGLVGKSTAEAFYVTCDSTNNSAATVDAGEVHVEVGVALSTPAEFIVINVSQFTGGSTVSETL